MTLPARQNPQDTPEPNRSLTDQPRADDSPLLMSADSEIQELYLKATDGCLGLEENNPYLIAGYTSDAIVNYRMMGLSYEAIEERVRTAIEKELERGVQKGYEAESNLGGRLTDQRARNTARLTFDSQDNLEAELVSASDHIAFFEKYDLQEYQRINRECQVRPAYEFHLGAASEYLALRDCVALAEKIGARDLAQRAVVQLIRVGDFEGLIKIADKERLNESLLDMAHLLLADFYDNRNGHYAPNYVWSAIDTLKRVRGDSKAVANQMLTNLALVLSGPELTDAMIRSRPDYHTVKNDPEELAKETTSLHNHLVRYAFYALRQTGEQLASALIDSSKIDIVTRINDPHVFDQAQKLWERMKQGQPDYRDQYALSCLVACGINDPLYALAEEHLRRDETEPSQIIWNYKNALEIYAGIGDQYSFDRVLQQCEEGGLLRMMTPHDHEVISIYRSVLSRGLQTYPIQTIFGGHYTDIDHTPVHQDQAILERKTSRERERLVEVKAIRAELSPERKRELLRHGHQLMEIGDFWNAHRDFFHAAYKPGLIQAARAMLQSGDAINVFEPLEIAACLPDEPDSLDVDNLPKLPDRSGSSEKPGTELLE